MAHTINLPEGYIQRIVSSVTSVVPTEAVYVFGSYARGEERKDSDLDLYVVTSDDAEGPRSALRPARTAWPISNTLSPVKG